LDAPFQLLLALSNSIECAVSNVAGAGLQLWVLDAPFQVLPALVYIIGCAV
jgi:hypothetical protein